MTAPVTAAPADSLVKTLQQPIADALPADDIQAKLAERFDIEVDDAAIAGQQSLIIKPDQILEVLRFLRDDDELKFAILVDITAVDYLSYPNWYGERFGVIYQLKSLIKRHRLRLKVFLEEDEAQIPSAHEIFNIANWLERETFDQYGIDFVGHPNLKRLLNHHEFVGHALRKDYPAQKRQHLSINDPMIDEMVQLLENRGMTVLDGAQTIVDGTTTVTTSGAAVDSVMPGAQQAEPAESDGSSSEKEAQA